MGHYESISVSKADEVMSDDKAVRAFKLFGIKKNGKYIVWGFPFKFVTRDEAEIFKTKEDALK